MKLGEEIGIEIYHRESRIDGFETSFRSYSIVAVIDVILIEKLYIK